MYTRVLTTKLVMKVENLQCSVMRSESTVFEMFFFYFCHCHTFNLTFLNQQIVYIFYLHLLGLVYCNFICTEFNLIRKKLDRTLILIF